MLSVIETKQNVTEHAEKNRPDQQGSEIQDPDVPLQR
jgi:hypothetical protein